MDATDIVAVITAGSAAAVALLAAVKFSRCNRIQCCCCSLEREVLDVPARVPAKVPAPEA